MKNLRLIPVSLVLMALVILAACSRSDVPEHALMLPNEALPDTVLGYVRWEGNGERRPIRQVSCQLEESYYVMVGEGRDFVLRVGFWGGGARDVKDIDFEQADSVELRAVDEDLYFYRYSVLRLLPEMGPVAGSPQSAKGNTRLRPTSTNAVVKHRAGLAIDFELSCPGQSETS